MGSKNLKLNFAPVGLRGDTEIHVGFCPFDVDILASLRKEFGETHVFRTHREDDTIIDIPVVQAAEPLSDKTMELDLKETHCYWAALLNAALIRAFSGKREIARDYPVEVLGSARRNLIGHDKLPKFITTICPENHLRLRR